ERRVLVEAVHLDRPFHRRAGAIELEGAVLLARDRHHAAVNLGRERPIDPKLRLAGALALGEGRIVEKRKAHRALDLQRAVAGEKYRGGMGIDALDRLAAMGRGVGEQREDRLLALAVFHPLGACLVHRRLGRGDALVGRRTISRWRRGKPFAVLCCRLWPLRRIEEARHDPIAARAQAHFGSISPARRNFPRARTSMAMNSSLRSMPLDTSMWSFG